MTYRTPPHILFFEERTIGARIGGLFVISVLMALYRFRFWQTRYAIERTVRPTMKECRRYQLARRFALGATAGFLASKYSYGWRHALRLNLLHADAFGHWSSFLITADAAMDSSRMSRDASVALLRRCFHALIDPARGKGLSFDASAISEEYVHVFGAAMNEGTSYSAKIAAIDHGLGRFAGEMASVVGRRLAGIADLHRGAGRGDDFKVALEEFYIRTLSLIDGQLSSLDQMLVDQEHDWGWYRGVLNSKSMDVLLTLLSLFVNSARRRHPAQNMKTCFFLVNRTFFHRQVLDDLLDIEEDISSGTANSVVYMIVSQGRVAARYAENEYARSRYDLVEEIERSCLLAPEFGLARNALIGRFRAKAGTDATTSNDVEALVKEALINREGDRAVAAAELIRTCIRRQQLLLNAWSRKEWDTVLAVVRESGIVTRILDSIKYRTDQNEVDSALRALNDEGVREVMHLFYIRTLRTYEKCLVACRPYF
jgi:hypothetical protein